MNLAATRLRAWLAPNAIVITAGLLFAAIAMSGVLTYQEIATIAANIDEGRRVNDAIDHLDAVVTDLTDAETGRRGLFQTTRSVEVHLRRIEQLSAGREEQEALLAQLRRVVAEKLAALEAATVGGDRGQALMESTRRTALAMKAEEQHARAVHRLTTAASARRALRMVVVTTSVAALLLLITFVQIERAARAQQLARSRVETAYAAELQAHRVKDEFIATVSHELRTPLTAILGWSRMLSAETCSSGLLEEGLQTIHSCATVQARLIDDLLDLSRILAGKMRLSVRTIDLAEAVQAGTESIRPAASAKGVTIVSDLDRGILVSGDPDRLQQVVWNLVANAVKFTPRGGNIKVNLKRTDSQTIIEVRDSGEGIDHAFLSHVFEPFRQADASKARVHKGLGLGLSIVKHLIEAHGGTVTVFSAGKGEGTTFRVSLPIMPFVTVEGDGEAPMVAVDSAEEVALVIPAGDALAGMTVVVVDDHVPTLHLLTAVLERSGARVLPARSAGEAFFLARLHHPDVIVSDIGMPDEDGLQLVTRIRALSGGDGAGTPMVALTAYVRQEDRLAILEAGFQEYLSKPVEPIELIDAIRRVAPFAATSVRG